MAATGANLTFVETPVWAICEIYSTADGPDGRSISQGREISVDVTAQNSR